MSEFSEDTERELGWRRLTYDEARALHRRDKMIADMLDADVAVSNGKSGCLIVPTYKDGHAKVEWDQKDKNDVEAARKYFVELKSKGYSFFRVDPKTGDKGEKIKEFDPMAEKIIAVPPFAGG